jgi:hypothetical protein
VSYTVGAGQPGEIAPAMPPKKGTCRVSLHAAQAFQALCEERGGVTFNCWLWTCRWQLGCRSTRLVHRTICFSKTERMHDLVMGLFINRYEFGVSI